MTSLAKATTAALAAALDFYCHLAQELIGKLLAETVQPALEKIRAGQYDLIENGELLNGAECLSGNWYFDVHGEHCLFKNLTTGQKLEISLGTPEDIGNLDPWFFYEFLQTTAALNYLTEFFPNPFADMLAFFEALEKENVLRRISGVAFRLSA